VLGDENQLSKRTYFAGIAAFLAVPRSASMAWVPFSIDSFLRLQPTVLLSTSANRIKISIVKSVHPGDRI